MKFSAWLSRGVSFKNESHLHFMLARRSWFAILGIVLLVVAAVLIWSYKTATLIVDGDQSTLQGFVWTVDDLLIQAGITPMAGDQIKPEPGTWLGYRPTVQINRAAQVWIDADDKLQVVLTTERDPIVLLEKAGIYLTPGDQILADGIAIQPDQVLFDYGAQRRAPALQVLRAVAFQISEADTSQAITATQGTLVQALWENGTVLNNADSLEPPPQTAISPDIRAALRRAKPVTILSTGISLTLQTSAETVGSALAQAGLPPQGLDYTIPPDSDPLPENATIRLVRVQEEVLIEQTPLPFETSYQAAADLEIDTQSVIQAGEYGISAKRIRVRYEDGIEVSRMVEDEWVARSPQARIIGFGTKLVPHTIDTPDGQITYWRAIQMYAVSYHPGTAGGEITASGLKVRKGLAAVDTRYIPLFTQLYVPGYGPALAADTGGGVKGRIIDLAYTTEEYVAWHEYVTVYFLWPPPANIVWIFP